MTTSPASTAKRPFHALYRKISDYRDCNRGIAALEFALLFPLFLAVFFAVAEIGYYKMNDRRAQFAVDFAAEFMSRDSDATTSWEEIWVMEDLWQIVNVTSFYNTGGNPYENGRGNYARSFASINFIPTPAGCKADECDYEPNVNWSFLATQGIAQPHRRHCNQTMAPNDFELDETMLPEGVKGMGALAVADFTFKYEPLLNLGLISEQEKHIYAIRKTRGGSTLGRSANSGHFKQC